MEGHKQKGISGGLILKNKSYLKWLGIIIVICILILIIKFGGLSFTGNAVYETYSLTDIQSFDYWVLGNSTGTLQVDYVAVQPEGAFINDTIYCINGSVSNDVSSILYLWYINGSLTKLNTSTIVGGSGGNFSTHDRIECGIIPQNDTSLVAYWPFDEGSGVAFREVINNNSGFSTSADWKLGRKYYAVNISVDNRYNVSSPVGLNLTNNFTYEIWFYQTGTSTGVLIDNAGKFYIQLTGGIAEGYMRISEALPSLKIVSSTTVGLNRWNQIVLTYNSVNVSLYLNGQLQNATNLTGNIVDYSGDIVIGRNSLQPTQYLRGQIDEIAIYNRSLNSGEILDHYNRGIAILSRENTVIVDAKVEDFQNGTLTNVSYSSVSGGDIFKNCGAVYCQTGEYISSIKTLRDDDYPLKIRYNMQSIPQGNISFLVRTGKRIDNGSIAWSSYSGIDTAYFPNSNKIIALPFSEGSGNKTLDLVYGTSYYLGNVDFTPSGKIGSGLRLLGNDSLDISDTLELKLAVTNFTIELFVKPDISNRMALFSKGKYFAFLNSSLNPIFNATCGGTEYTIISNTSLTEDQWNYIAITRDADGETRLYVNGVITATETFASTIDVGSNTLTLGKLVNVDAFNGSMDSFVISNRTISSEEISNRMNSLNPTENIMDYGDYLQVKALFTTSNVSTTPVLTNITIRPQNHSVIIYDSKPYGTRISAPVNASNVSTGSSTNFNWTQAQDLESNSLYYEFRFSNYSNFSRVIVSYSGINNHSLQTYSDPQTVLVEHFDYKEDLVNHNWEGNWSATNVNGRFGGGFELSSSGKYLMSSRPIIDSEQGAIEFWIQPYWSGDDGNNNYFLDHRNRGLSLNRTGSQILYSVGVTSASKLTYNISDWNAGEWHHIAISWKENNNISLIIDGIQVNTTTISDIDSFSGNDFYFGSNAVSNGVNNNVVNGILDELKISNVYRYPYSELTVQERNVNITNISDGDYYWDVKAIQQGNFSFDTENTTLTTDTGVVNLRRYNPTITFIQNYVKTYSQVSTTINFSSSEDVFCQFSFFNSNTWTTLNETNGSVHAQKINLTNFGNFTYYFRCNDSNNNYVNKTYSFYVFDSSVSPFTNISEKNFTGGVRSGVNTSFGEDQIGYLEVTARNNMTSNLGIIKFLWNKNPENSSTGLESQVIAFWTVLLDDNLVANLTGNVTVGLIYNTVDVSGVSANNASVYWFNPRTSTWEYQGVNIMLDQYVAVINTSRFGSFALCGNYSATSLPRSTASSSGGGGLTRGLLRPPFKTAFKGGGFGEIVPTEIEEIVEEAMIEEEEKEETEEGSIIEQIENYTQDIFKWTGFFESKGLMMIIYLVVLGIMVFYGSRLALTFIFKYQNKNKMHFEDLEIKIDSKMKYLAYSNKNSEKIKEEFLKKGLSQNKIDNLLYKVNNLGKGKFEDYIYKSLAKGENEEEITKKLVSKGWEEDKIKKEIENFKNI